MVRREPEIKFARIDLFVRMKAQIEQSFPLKVDRWSHDLAGVQCCGILALVVRLLLLIFAASSSVRLFVVFVFSCVLSLRLGPFVIDLVSAENLRTVNFTAMDK